MCDLTFKEMAEGKGVTVTAYFGKDGITIGTADWELTARTQAVSNILASFWEPGWYSRVFIQDRNFQWHAMFSSQGHVLTTA